MHETGAFWNPPYEPRCQEAPVAGSVFSWGKLETVARLNFKKANHHKLQAQEVYLLRMSELSRLVIDIGKQDKAAICRLL